MIGRRGHTALGTFSQLIAPASRFMLLRPPQFPQQALFAEVAQFFGGDRQQLRDANTGDDSAGTRRLLDSPEHPVISLDFDKIASSTAEKYHSDGCFAALMRKEILSELGAGPAAADASSSPAALATAMASTMSNAAESTGRAPVVLLQHYDRPVLRAPAAARAGVMQSVSAVLLAACALPERTLGVTFTGQSLGIELTQHRRRTVVTKVSPGSDAWEAGVRPGDELLALSSAAGGSGFESVHGLPLPALFEKVAKAPRPLRMALMSHSGGGLHGGGEGGPPPPPPPPPAPSPRLLLVGGSFRMDCPWLQHALQSEANLRELTFDLRFNRYRNRGP
jgi:hypothetical protein